MTTFDYAALATRAGTLLARFGQTLALRRLSGGTYDPVTGATSGTVTTTDTSVSAVKVDIDARYRAEVGNDNVRDDDALYLLANTLAPELSDSLVIATAPWSIVRIKEIAPGATGVVYFVQVRR